MTLVQRLCRIGLTLMLIGGLAACEGMTTRQRDTAIGAGLGGVAGAALGGSALSTLGGAAVGGIVGNQVGK